jgi:hypothetical protein
MIGSTRIRCEKYYSTKVTPIDTETIRTGTEHGILPPPIALDSTTIGHIVGKPSSAGLTAKTTRRSRQHVNQKPAGITTVLVQHTTAGTTVVWDHGGELGRGTWDRGTRFLNLKGFN